MNVTIIGAGLSGLIGATQFPGATVLEANGPEQLSHKAVLRFRTDTVSRLTGIPFRKVTVRKSIWHMGEHVYPDIQLANMYSIKTNGGYLDRSIWNLEPVERYIAPENLQHQLAEMIGPRIKWNAPVDRMQLIKMERPVISTLPMPLLLNLLDLAHDQDFKYSSIEVDRWRVMECDVYQTIYFPNPMFSTYRASITGNLLIIERRGELSQTEFLEVLKAFGIRGSMDVELIQKGHSQRFGKIAPINEEFRCNSIFTLTHEHGLYSLGRFAVWRNILLDDVASDAAVIKRLIAGGKYSASLHHYQKG